MSARRGRHNVLREGRRALPAALRAQSDRVPAQRGELLEGGALLTPGGGEAEVVLVQVGRRLEDVVPVDVHGADVGVEGVDDGLQGQDELGHVALGGRDSLLG